MSEPKWTHNLDPEIGEFYDAAIEVNGQELLVLSLMKTEEGWEGVIMDAGGNKDIRSVKMGPCSPSNSRVSTRLRVL